MHVHILKYLRVPHLLLKESSATCTCLFDSVFIIFKDKIVLALIWEKFISLPLLTAKAFCTFYTATWPHETICLWSSLKYFLLNAPMLWTTWVVHFEKIMTKLMTKLNFQQPFLQSSMSQIILICWIGAQETFLIIINIYCLIILWKPWHIFSELFNE